ncbi:MAG TPA: hypothetical protein VJ767_12265 [Nitrososphaeraceae archaeon]|nr:hypothetical protein [Nitrososphaeraceae archaeon]
MFQTAGAKSNIVNIVNLKSINKTLNKMLRGIGGKKTQNDKSIDDQLAVPSMTDMEFNWSDK